MGIWVLPGERVDPSNDQLCQLRGVGEAATGKGGSQEEEKNNVN